MLLGEALNKAKKWQRELNEGQALFVDQEELKQFMDICVVALKDLKEKSNG